MPNGLAIYHLKIKSHRSKHTAVIAGPHSSFYKLAEQTGNTAFLMEKFTEGLQTWRKLGAPKIRNYEAPPMTSEDLQLALSLNKGEIPINIKHTKEVDSDEEDSKHGRSADEEFRICLHGPHISSKDGKLRFEPIQNEEVPRARLRSATRADILDEDLSHNRDKRNSTLDPILEEDEDELVEMDTVRESSLYVIP